MKKKKTYAIVQWSAEDIQARKPDWSLKQCEKWLKKNESGLKDVLTQLGNEALDDMVFNDEDAK